MIRFRRSSFPFASFIVRVAAFSAIGCATQSHAETSLQASYSIGPKSEKTVVESALHDPSSIEVPLRLEYELTTRVVRMTQTTKELRAIIETMPGPTLPSVKTPPPPPVSYANLLEETLARLNHVEQLIAEITHIIRGMPGLPRNETTAAIPSLSSPAAPQAEGIATHTTVAPRPLPKPPSSPDISTPVPIVRAISLAIGGLIATVLAIYLRRRFLRSRPSRKELATAIEVPSLRDDALELADVMTSMGLADGAAQGLVEHIRTNPRQALTHWLRLLTVYRQTGKRVEFEKAAEEVHSTFNIKPENWNENDNGDNHDASLENYPHITAQLKKLWPTPECSEYLLSLLADNRNGTREGFPPPVAEEIVLLLAMLHTEESASSTYAGLSIST